MPQDKLIKITTGGIIYDIIKLFVFNYSFLTYYLYSYITLPDDIQDHYISKLFLTFIINAFILSLIPIIEIRYKIKYNNKTISETIWNKILPFNRFPLSFLKFGYIVAIIMGAWICSIFIPLGKNDCAIYGNYNNACKSMQIISVIMMILFTFIGLILFFLSIMIIKFMCNCQLGSFCCALCSFCKKGTTNNFVPQFIIKMIKHMNPIPQFTSSETDCGICLEALTDDKNKNIVITLNCGHKYHKQCVSQWFITGATSCPTCRTEVIDIIQYIDISV